MVEEKKHQHVCKFQKIFNAEHEECSPEQVKECHGEEAEHHHCCDHHHKSETQ